MKYRAIAAVSLPVGAVVKMAPEQLRRRRHLVKPAQAAGWCEVTAEFQFKPGEEFETGHGMSKANTVALDAPEVAAPAPAPAPAASTPTTDAPPKAAPAKPAVKR